MKALVLVDLQNDFMSGGSLAINQGDDVVPVANRLITDYSFDRIIATMDWHSPLHKSFAANHKEKKVGDIVDIGGIKQILWPNHCVFGTKGAEFHNFLFQNRITTIIRKGFNENFDSYSAFFDVGKNPTGLSGLVSELKLDLFVMGLATDYCVKYTVLDACKLGIKTHLFTDGCRAVNIQKDDEILAIQEMSEAGCVMLKSSNFKSK